MVRAPLRSTEPKVSQASRPRRTVATRTAPTGFLPDLLGLQQTLGNRAVGRLLQPKLVIGAPHDKYEREADRVAELVMRVPDATVPPITPLTSVIQRTCAGCAGSHPCPTCAEEEEDLLLSKARSAPSSGDADLLTSASNLVREPGRSLPIHVRQFFEPRFRSDFSRVRVHTDYRAAALARGFGARAFTVGNHIAFAAGEYRPRPTEGRRLLAHELAHVRQQSVRGANSVDRKEAEPLKKDKAGDCVGSLGIGCPDYLNEDIDNVFAGPGTAYGTCKEPHPKKPGEKGFKPLDTLWFSGTLSGKCKTDTCKVKGELSGGKEKAVEHAFDKKDLLPGGGSVQRYDWHNW